MYIYYIHYADFLRRRRRQTTDRGFDDGTIGMMRGFVHTHKVKVHKSIRETR